MSRSKVLGILLVAGALSLLISLAIALAQGAEGTVTIRDSDDTNFSDKLSDRALIKLNLPPLPSTQAYEGWFVSAEGPTSAGVFTQDSEGNVDQTFWLTAEANSLALNFSGIQPLANGLHYEGWAIIDGSPVSTGKFNVDASGNLVDLSGNLIANGEFVVTGTDLSGATAIVLTIEPAGDTDVVPSTTKFMGGDVSGLSANLAVSHGAALGDDFLGASGKYILATPTDDPAANENSGIWFLDLSGGSPAQGLQLPSLPASWIYEGWAVINGTPVSTGRFSDPAGADLDAPFSGPNAGPPFPGEDFLVNAPAGLTFPTDLAGATAVISIEPVPDDSAAPFTLKPLVGAIPSDGTDHVTYSMDNKAAGFPTGTATISGRPTGENLFARFDRFVISIEPVPDDNPLPSADKPYGHKIPDAGILHIRHLTYSLAGNPAYTAGFHKGTPKGLAVGLREQVWVAWFHANLAVNSKTLAEVQQHACHSVNIIEGTGGENYDGTCGDPGDGFGVLAYADGTALHAGLAASAASDDPVIVKHHKEVVDSAGNAKAWATLARDQALFAKGASDIGAAKLFASNARSRLGQTLDGADADGDGTVERITGEGGAKQAYWAAQDMGTYTFVAAAPTEEVPTEEPPKVGDPILPKLAWPVLALGALLLLAGAFLFRRSRVRA